MYVLNAGGLISMPALSSFLGVSSLPRPERLFVLGFGATGFAAGLVCAALCSLFVYFNFQRHAELACSRSEQDKFGVGVMLGIVGQDTEERDRIRSEQAAEIAKHGRRINFTFRAAHFCGWLSVLCFLGGASWLAVNLR